MAKKERVTPQLDEEELSPEEEEYWRMSTQGYSRLDSVEAWARDKLTKDYVLKFSSMNSTSGKTTAHRDFEKYVDQNRQEISRKASDSLGINWEEIETR